MDAKIFFITLSVDDLNRSLAFYRDGLGWPTEGIVCRQLSPGPAAGTLAWHRGRRRQQQASQSEHHDQGTEPHKTGRLVYCASPPALIRRTAPEYPLGGETALPSRRLSIM